jgi:hypothetical protein
MEPGKVDQAYWPRFLWHAVERFGPEAVERVGLEVLGYPPAALVTCYAEAIIVFNALSERFENVHSG